MANVLDSWTITDADGTWDFRVTVEHDGDAGRPEGRGDVYDAEMVKENGPEAEQWAKDAVKAWENGEWCFAVISVTPILKGSDVVFQSATAAVGGCDWGWLPGGEDGKGTWTSDRPYARDAWIDDLIVEAKGAAEEALAKIKGATS